MIFAVFGFMAFRQVAHAIFDDSRPSVILAGAWCDADSAGGSSKVVEMPAGTPHLYLMEGASFHGRNERGVTLSLPGRIELTVPASAYIGQGVVRGALSRPRVSGREVGTFAFALAIGSILLGLMIAYTYAQENNMSPYDRYCAERERYERNRKG